MVIALSLSSIFKYSIIDLVLASIFLYDCLTNLGDPVEPDVVSNKAKLGSNSSSKA